MPPKKPGPVTKTAPKSTIQKPAGRGTAAKVGAKKPSTAAAKPGATGSKGTPARKGVTSPSRTQVKGKTSPQVECLSSFLHISFLNILVSMVTRSKRVFAELLRVD